MKNRLEKILIVDDEPGMCRLLESVLGGEGYQVVSFQKPQEALQALERTSFDLVVTDIRMPRVNGMQILEAVRSQSPDIPVVLITAFGTLESAVQAMKQGASDFVAKPFKNEQIKLAVNNALEKQRLRDENKRLKAELASRYQFGQIIGKSAKMQETFQVIAQLAQSDVAVLIHGESGTGKEIVSRAIHCNSSRSGKPFIPIHCGALPETLMESELFGHVKGAFTDALKDRAGLLESAEGGTVFLDEVGDMPLPLQVKLLRFLQDHEVRRVGSSESRRVDVRVIAATNKDLKQAVVENKFREDLYYRLAVVTIQLPPLRDREDDIPLLVEHFLRKAADKRAPRHHVELDRATMQSLLAHDWPGNIRELENAIEHAVALTEGSAITPQSLPRTVHRDGPSCPAPIPLKGLAYRDAKQKVLESFERPYLAGLLEQAKGNITQAAHLADMDRKNLYELLKKYGLSPTQETTDAPR